MAVRRLAALVLPALLWVTQALGDAPQTSVRPMPRGGAVQSQPLALPSPATGTEATPVSTIRPRPRPAAPETVPALQPGVNLPADAGAESAAAPRRGGLFGLLRPAPRPKIKAGPEPATAKRKDRSRAETAKGSVCGVAAIKGEKVARITSKVQGCGVEDPVRITSVSGVRLSQPATLDCDTAIALNRWVEGVLQPAFGRNKVAELKIAAHYICRPRNNKRGAKVSEHGRGKAVDVSGFVLESGKELSILRDYNRTIAKAHRGACGIFGTTLGPGSDGYHEDHLHFDTARHGNGPYCR